MDTETQQETGNGEATPERRGTVTRDPEVVAMTRIFTLLDALDESAKSRVVRYITERYEELLEA